MARPFSDPSRQQSGIATLLILLMLGLAVSVTIAASIYALRSNQQRQVTTHALTAVQAASWRAVEVVRRYLAGVDANTYQSWADGYLTLPVAITGLELLGIPDRSAQLTQFQRTQSGYRATVLLTAFSQDQVSAGTQELIDHELSPTASSATLEAVYDVTPDAKSLSLPPPECAVLPKANLVFNHDLEITGGSLGVMQARDFHNIAVNGSLRLTHANQAFISGCAKGDVTLSGGGVRDGGHLYSEGSIHIDQMRSPSNTTLWARDIQIGSQVSGGQYQAIQAGAFVASVRQQNQPIGTAFVGGVLHPRQAPTQLPATSGVIYPHHSGQIEIVRANGSKFLVDLSQTQMNPATGDVSHVTAATTLLTGTPGEQLPDELQFVATEVIGGTVDVTATAARLLWGQSVNLNHYGGRYDTVWANGRLLAGTAQIGELIGGADLVAQSAGLYWNFPQMTTGHIAGQLRYGTHDQLVPEPARAIARLRTDQMLLSPGLPGLPYCDTRVDPVSAAPYKMLANYLFESKEGIPYLTIQHVRTRDGALLDGTYNLRTDDVRRLHGQPFLSCHYQAVDHPEAFCFRDKQTGTPWQLHGLTHFPRGLVWFDDQVMIDGTQLHDEDGNMDLIATLVAADSVNLTQSGHKRLIGLNQSSPSLLCDQAWYPDNFCDKSQQPTRFRSWKDRTGQPHEGLPAGNLALVTEGDVQLSGWQILGSVLLGRTLSTAANRARIVGSLVVGANTSGGLTSMNQGGMDIVVPDHPDQAYLTATCESTPTEDPPSRYQVKVLWSRYQ